MRHAQWLRLGFLLLVALGTALRLAPQGRYVTPDEPAWAYRSIQFLDAVGRGAWNSVPNTGHPGVTTMWMGSLGMMARRVVDRAETEDDLEWIMRMAWLEPDNGEAYRHLAPFLPGGRLAVVLMSVAGLILLIPVLTPLFGQPVAVLAVGLLLLDPFLAGHSGLLHTDALLATFSLLGLVAALRGADDPHSPVWWSAAGALSGLALLTKTPGLVLLPFTPIVLTVGYLRVADVDARMLGGHVRFLLLHALLFAGCFGLTVFALYPAMWGQPAVVMEKLLAFGGDHVRSVQRPVYFLGRTTYDPGAAFYPVVFLFRTSPVVLVGLFIGAVGWRRLPSDRRFAFIALLAFASLFALGLTLGAKKHDRYLLPALPPLTLAAVVGASGWWDRAGPGLAGPRWAGHNLAGHGLAPLFQTSGVLIQVLIALASVTYPLLYFNPLLGGPRVGTRVLDAGWGESVGAAARRLNALPSPSDLTVAARDVPSFASMFAGHTLHLDEEGHNLALADYVVGGSQEARLPYLKPQASVQTVAADPTVIYANTAPEEQALYISARVASDDLVVLDAETPLVRRYRGPAEMVALTSMADPLSVADWLAQEAGSRERIWLVASEGASPITSAIVRSQVEAIADGEGGTTVAGAELIQFVRRASTPTPAPLAYRALFGGDLVLIDAHLQEAAAWPGSIPTTLRWQAAARPGGDYRAVVALRDADGHTWAVAEELIRNEVAFPTSAWKPQAWSDATYCLDVPAGVPPGTYEVEISLYDRATGARLGAAGLDGDFVGTRVPVGTVSVQRPQTAPDVAELDPSLRLDASIGPLTLLGANPPAAEAASGDRLSFSLYWQAETAPEADYHLRIQWVDSEGQACLEKLEPMSAYATSRWRAGDRFQTRHRVHVSTVLPAGRYELTLRLFDASSGSSVGDPIPLTVTEIRSRDRSFSLPDEDLQPMDLVFGEYIHLCGYRVDETDLAPGGMLPLTLCWRAGEEAGALDGDLSFFVHLLGPDGVVRGQVDRVPGGGAWPTSSWAPGQVIVDRIDLPVPPGAPPGEYTMAVGFYDPQYGGRLSVTTGAQGEEHATRAVLPVQVTVSQEVE